MNVPLIFDGNLCVGGVARLYPCCPSDTEIEYFAEYGGDKFTSLQIGQVLVIVVTAPGGFKIRAECCQESGGGYVGAGGYDGPGGIGGAG